MLLLRRIVLPDSPSLYNLSYSSNETSNPEVTSIIGVSLASILKMYSDSPFLYPKLLKKKCSSCC